MKKYKVFDIAWDVDDLGDDEFDDPRLDGTLPSGVTIEVQDDFDPTEEIADYLSEDYGWCVKSCSFEEIKR